MWDDLEEFSARGKSRQKKPIAAIRIDGVISFCRSFSDAAISELKDNTHVALVFSKKNNAIVLNFTNKKRHPKAMKVTKRHNISFGVKSLFNYYEISHEVYVGKFEVKLENIPNLGKCWVILLNNRIS